MICPKCIALHYDDAKKVYMDCKYTLSIGDTNYYFNQCPECKNIEIDSETS